MTSPPPLHRFARLLGTLSLAGCAIVTDSSDTPGVALEIVASMNSADSVPAGITVTTQQVAVRGTFSTPCVSYGVTAGARQTGQRLEITLSGRRNGELCALAIGYYTYTATVPSLPSGSTQVIVRHRIEDANWPVATVLDTTVVVP
ncbi:MAG: hypothetical protein IT355_08210 [Gemmatimonadaceae bacterium]|nr:hypothetical protein [Gemmatimonadaceae bacterium]